MIGGVALLVVFVFVETKVAEPLFRISLFRIRAFAAGNIASLRWRWAAAACSSC